MATAAAFSLAGGIEDRGGHNSRQVAWPSNENERSEQVEEPMKHARHVSNSRRLIIWGK